MYFQKTNNNPWSMKTFKNRTFNFRWQTMLVAALQEQWAHTGLWSPLRLFVPPPTPPSGLSTAAYAQLRSLVWSTSSLDCTRVGRCAPCGLASARRRPLCGLPTACHWLLHGLASTRAEEGIDGQGGSLGHWDLGARAPSSSLQRLIPRARGCGDWRACSPSPAWSPSSASPACTCIASIGVSTRHANAATGF